jgi:hypothetical protein
LSAHYLQQASLYASIADCGNAASYVDMHDTHAMVISVYGFWPVRKAALASFIKGKSVNV